MLQVALQSFSEVMTNSLFGFHDDLLFDDFSDDCLIFDRSICAQLAHSSFFKNPAQKTHTATEHSVEERNGGIQKSHELVAQNLMISEAVDAHKPFTYLLLLWLNEHEVFESTNADPFCVLSVMNQTE